MQRILLSLGCASLAWLVAPAALAQSAIGDAARAVNDVTGVMGARRSAIVTGSAVHQNEVVSTGPSATADLRFRDNTALHVASGSTVKLDRYVYNSDGSARGAVVSMTKGVFRFTTGQSNPGAFRLQTPQALIGIRGTVFEVQISGGVTQVTLSQGIVDVCLRSNPRTCTSLTTPGATVRVTSRSLGGDNAPSNQQNQQPTQRASGNSGAADTQAVLRLINQHRAANGLPPVQSDARLIRAAQQHAQAMASSTSMSHDAGGSFEQRMTSQGIRGWQAENIAAGYNSVGEVFANWQVSGKHNANMLHDKMRKIGLARSVGADGRSYWTMVLASQ
ncbi:MAG: CAP domain-containing protein [Beijerinckiaceae bacterium]